MVIENHSHFEIKEKSSQSSNPASNSINFFINNDRTPGLWHFKAHNVIFPNLLKVLSKVAPRGPLTRGAPLLGVVRVALKPALMGNVTYFGGVSNCLTT